MNHEQRLQKLEELTMHLQHDLEELNAGLSGHLAEFKELSRIVHELNGRVDRIVADLDGEGAIENEKPPHY